MTSEKMVIAFTTAFTEQAIKGIQAFQTATGRNIAPTLSHVCFKFQDIDAYKEYLEIAKELGALSSEEFNGKEISWCKLNQSLHSNGLVLEWLEMVEPRVDKNPFNGVTSIGYYSDAIQETLKIQSEDKNILFRYQSECVQPK